ncbi:MAG: DNA polymerase IV [Lachnospiraceae bacterium]|nr:DNA polymerase IV [Lachnospiraceae bacterium]
MESEGRTIFHVDVNSAFLSWSALKRLEEDPDAVDLRTIPSGVGGDVKTRHGIITAKSIPAKKYGVQTGEPVVKALQKCPQLVLVPPDFETYRKYSHALMEILSRYSPLLQQVSIDEAYLDVTERVSEKETSGVVCPQVGCKETSGVICTQETSGVVCTSGGERKRAIALARQIRDQVRAELGFTVNVGISCNKLLAKMASDFEKPDRTHTLYPEEVPAKMWPLPIEALHGCGKSTAQKLQLIGINTIGDAAAADRALLQSFLGQSSGAYIWNSANGISKSKVVAEREQAKSVSNERTLSEDIGRENYQADGVPVICMLSQKVAGRLQKSGLVGQTITFQIKSSDFERHSRQMSLQAMTDQSKDIEAAALLLADQLLGGPEGLFAQGVTIRLIGVGVSRLSEKEKTVHQMDLFEWAERNEEEESRRAEAEKAQKAEQEAREKAQRAAQAKKARQDKLDAMMGKLNERYGKGTIRKGSSE